MMHQAIVCGFGHDPFNFIIDQLSLGLRVEPRIGELDADNCHQAFANIIAGNVRILLLKQIIFLRVLVDCSRQRGTEASEVRAPIDVGNGVGVAQNLVVVAVVVLDHYINEHIVGLVRNHNGLGMHKLFVLAQLPDKLLDAVAIKKCFRLVVLAVVNKSDLHARIQEGQLTQSGGKHVEIKFRRDCENLRVRFEGHQGAGTFGFADDLKLAGGFAAFKFHRVHFAVAAHFHLEPF